MKIRIMMIGSGNGCSEEDIRRVANLEKRFNESPSYERCGGEAWNCEAKSSLR
jgi:hypothetical protein